MDDVRRIQLVKLTVAEEHPFDFAASVEMAWFDEEGQEHSDHAEIRSDSAEDCLGWAQTWIATRRSR